MPYLDFRIHAAEPNFPTPLRQRFTTPEIRRSATRREIVATRLIQRSGERRITNAYPDQRRRRESGPKSYS